MNECPCWTFVSIVCFISQKEERVSELRNQLSERQALRSRRRPSSTNLNHSTPPLSVSHTDPKSLLPPPGYPIPTSDNHSLPPTFSNSTSVYQPDGKISRNNCHASRLQLLYKWGNERSRNVAGRRPELKGGRGTKDLFIIYLFPCLTPWHLCSVREHAAGPHHIMFKSCLFLKLHLQWYGEFAFSEKG